MPESSAQPGTREQETKQHKAFGVMVYARTDAQGKPSKLDAIDTDSHKIRQIADLLQHRGFGVLRQRNPRAGRTYHRLQAIWAGPGDPPSEPFQNT